MERRIFTGFIRDLTSREKIEDELRQSQKMEAVGQLTGGVAHDFNNLLTVITANLEMLAPHLGDPDQRELAKEAHDAAQDGAKLAAQLLAFGRRQPLNPKPTDLGPLVSNFAELLRRTLGESIELRILVVGSAHLTAVDSSLLLNALLNLAINARDAMPDGGRLTVEITHARLDADYAQAYPDIRTGHYVLITVTDTGSGMSEEVRRRAFEPFFTTKPTGAGTGLGLSMVYGFVKQSGGNIQIYSEPGQGTSVRVFLPVADSVGTDAAPGTVESREAELPQGSETILLVEDDPRLRRVLGKRLRSLGYQIIEADSGAAALDQLAARPDVAMIFTDMVMPGGMTGFDLAHAALGRKTRPQSPVHVRLRGAGDRPSRTQGGRLAQEALHCRRTGRESSRGSSRLVRPERSRLGQNRDVVAPAPHIPEILENPRPSGRASPGQKVDCTRSGLHGFDMTMSRCPRIALSHPPFLRGDGCGVSVACDRGLFPFVSLRSDWAHRCHG